MLFQCLLFITWHFNFIWLAFSIGFQLSFYKFIGKRKLFAFSSDCIGASQKRFLNAKTVKTCLTVSVVWEKKANKSCFPFPHSDYVTSFSNTFSIHLWVKLISFPISFSSHAGSKVLISHHTHRWLTSGSNPVTKLCTWVCIIVI